MPVLDPIESAVSCEGQQVNLLPDTPLKILNLILSLTELQPKLFFLCGCQNKTLTGHNYCIVAVKSNDMLPMQTPVHNLQKTLATEGAELCSNGQYLAPVCFATLILPADQGLET